MNFVYKKILTQILKPCFSNSYNRVRFTTRIHKQFMTVIYHGKTGFKILFFRFLMNLLNTNQNFCNFANKLNTPFMAKNSLSHTEKFATLNTY